MYPEEVPSEFQGSVSDDYKHVVLAGHGLTSWPEWLENLAGLTTLDLSDNGLTEISDSIGNFSSLAELDLSRNELINIPDSICNLTALTQLELSHNELTALPHAVGNLTMLTELDLSYNKLTDIPNSICNMTALTQLELANNRLTALPNSIGDLTLLPELNLEGNELAALPNSIGKIATLTKLNLEGNQLTALPDSIGNLTALTEVDVANNRLTALPDSIGNLTALTKLNLEGNQLTTLPDSIGNLTALSQLDLVYNRLTALPTSIGNLTALIQFELRYNKLTAIPDVIGNLTGLTKLNFDKSLIDVLPDSIGNLTGLTALSFDSNQLVVLPDSIGNLTALIQLNLHGNRLISLPNTIRNLRALTDLNLEGNQLTDLPDSIGALRSLTELNLQGNRLANLPSSIGNLRALAELNLEDNQLTRLPMQLADLLTRQGLHFRVVRNPLSDPLPEIVRRGTEALATYLRSLEDAIAQYEAKLLLVGEGNVGKSSLVAALVGAPFVEDRSTTHGIEITSLTLPHPTLDQGMTLLAWDFGGQEVYRVTHPFFFSQRALYLLVWNARDGQERDQVEGWLRRIRLRAGSNVRTLIVATHCAERLPDLDYPHLKQSFSGMLAGSFEVDNRAEIGLSDLKKAISREAAGLPPMGQMISPRWVAARKEILDRAEAEPQIRYEDFAEVCEFHNVIGSEIVTLAELMHDLGHIIYYGEDEGLRDIVVLNPEWLTKAISYVLEDKPTRDAGGVLDHARLREIWQDRPDGPSYPARYHRYFLRLMEKFDISYRLEGDELHSLVAQLVPHQRPTDLPWQPRTAPPPGLRALALVCRLAEPAPGLIPWLTVRHHRASTGKHWRRGVFLRHPIDAYASQALIELRHDTELALEVRAPSPDLYFNVLRDSVEDLIARRWPGLTYELLIPCPVISNDGSMCPGQFSLDALLRWRANHITEVPCSECARIHEISFLVTGFTTPSQTIDSRLNEVYERLRNQLDRIEVQAAVTAESVRRVLRVVSTEVNDCPRLFTIVLERPSGGRRIRIDQRLYRLTLWCEHPGYWHPWDSASYMLDQPREWLIQIWPYAQLICRTLQLVVPLTGSVADVLLPSDQLSSARRYLNLMKAFVDDFPDQLEEHETSVRPTAGRLTPAEGQALRAIRAILFECDRLRAFGGMRRVQAASGDFLWVCPGHYPEYDPGLPIVP